MEGQCPGRVGFAFRNNETNENHLRSSNDRAEGKGHDAREREIAVPGTRFHESAHRFLRPFYFVDSTIGAGREPRNERIRVARSFERATRRCLLLQLEDDKTN